MKVSQPHVLWEVLVFFCNQIQSGSKDATSSLPTTIKNAATSLSADVDCASASRTDKGSMQPWQLTQIMTMSQVLLQLCAHTDTDLAADQYLPRGKKYSVAAKKFCVSFNSMYGTSQVKGCPRVHCPAVPCFRYKPLHRISIQLCYVDCFIVNTHTSCQAIRCHTVVE